MGSTITKPKKQQIQRKISSYFILCGKKWVLPSPSKSHVKILVIFLLGGGELVPPSRNQKTTEPT